MKEETTCYSMILDTLVLNNKALSIGDFFFERECEMGLKGLRL